MRRLIVSTTLVLIAGLLLIGCRREQTQTQERPTATLTSTPFSTPLPAVPTEIPPGIESNPLTMIIYSDSPGTATSAASRFERALLEEAALYIDVVVRSRYAESLAALCNSTGSDITVVWLDGLTYAAAQAQNCGTPVMQVERGEGDDASTGQAVQVIVNRDLGIGNLGALSGRNFCRLGYDDFYTWIAPTLMFRASSLNPDTAIEEIIDYEDVPTLLQAVADGDCDATGIPEGLLEESEYADLTEDIRVAGTSVAFPYGILMYPIGVPLGVRIQLTDALEAIAENPEMAGTMRSLIGQDALVPVEEGDFNLLLQFIDRTGLDLALMGS